ncbi:MAG TPA: HIT family protein [Candidatus Paceibacterota bacterium]|nr:HIT family protein [Candidatus Paceibacterota bacterium]
MDCLFCKIITKQIPAQIIYENDRVLAFLDVQPRSPGHTMVIPKFHAPNFLELPEAEVAPLFEAVKKMAELLSTKLTPDGITIGINQGRASGQEVDHLHVHLMPRWKNDAGHAVQSVVNNPPKETLEEIKKKLVG